MDERRKCIRGARGCGWVGGVVTEAPSVSGAASMSLLSTCVLMAMAKMSEQPKKAKESKERLKVGL